MIKVNNLNRVCHCIIEADEYEPTEREARHFFNQHDIPDTWSDFLQYCTDNNTTCTPPGVLLGWLGY